MFTLSVPLHEIILAACLAATTLAILGLTLLILRRPAPARPGPHLSLPLSPGPYADAEVLQSWFGSLRAAPAFQPAFAPAMGGATGRVIPFEASRPAPAVIERRRHERRA